MRWSPSWRRCGRWGSRPPAPPSTPCRRAAERGLAARDTPVSHPIAAVASAVGLTSWSLEPAVTVPAVAAAALYWRGFTVLSLRMPERFDAWRPVAFLAGLGTLVLSLCSPLDPPGHFLLQAHMSQHLLLMLVVPPL